MLQVQHNRAAHSEIFPLRAADFDVQRRADDGRPGGVYEESAYAADAWQNQGRTVRGHLN